MSDAVFNDYIGQSLKLSIKFIVISHLRELINSFKGNVTLIFWVRFKIYNVIIMTKP